MFNLLPKEEQKAVDREYIVRLFATSLLFLASIGLAAVISIIPSLFLSYQKERILEKNNTTLAEEVGSGGMVSLPDILKQAEQQALALSTGTSTPYFYELIGDITRNTVGGSKIHAISISRADDATFDIVITGVASDRDTLLSFARRLEREKIFASVTVPVSNFAAATDIRFSIIVKTK